MNDLAEWIRKRNGHDLHLLAWDSNLDFHKEKILSEFQSNSGMMNLCNRGEIRLGSKFSCNKILDYVHVNEELRDKMEVFEGMEGKIIESDHRIQMVEVRIGGIGEIEEKRK